MSKFEPTSSRWHEIAQFGIPTENAQIFVRLSPLILHLAAQAGTLERLDGVAQARLRAAAASQALLLAVLDGDVRNVVSALGQADIHSVLLKGVALAHSHYPAPSLRPRGDTDLLVPESDRDRAGDVLVKLGFAASGAVDGDLVTQQAQWRRTLPHGLVHTVDVHWRLFNPHAFAHVLSPEEVLNRAQPIASLGPYARGPSAVDALVLACVHRVAHHPGDDDPIWLYDIHLLVEALSPIDADAFVRLVRERQVARISADGIDRAHAMFHTRLPLALAALITADTLPVEPSAEFLKPGRRQVTVLASDLRALPGWRPRLRLLAQHLFPPIDYMERQYGVRGRARLAPFYAWRIVRGARRWVIRPRP